MNCLMPYEVVGIIPESKLSCWFIPVLKCPSGPFNPNWPWGPFNPTLNSGPCPDKFPWVENWLCPPNYWWFPPRLAFIWGPCPENWLELGGWFLEGENCPGPLMLTEGPCPWIPLLKDVFCCWCCCPSPSCGCCPWSESCGPWLGYCGEGPLSEILAL